MNSLPEQGRALYKRREYRKAIECFDCAIGRATSVQLLDNRAACYEKLGELSHALKDAKKAIQLHREDATGYLRAGKILTKMEKPIVALDIYTHGLKCIKHVGQGYELMRKAHKEVLDTVSPPKSVDPFTLLPRELSRAVLDYLSFRQRMNACLVSKGWAHYIRSTPELWSHLDLTDVRSNKKVPTSFISRAINTGRSRLRRASLNRLYDFEKTLTALVKQCPLEELMLLDCGMQGSKLSEILRAAKHLKAFQLDRGTSMAAWDFSRVLDGISDRIETLSLNVDRMVSLDFAFPKLSRFDAKVGGNALALLQAVPDFFPAISSLTIHQDGLTRGDWVSNPIYRIELDKCKQLSRLDLIVPTCDGDTLTLPQSLVSLRLSPLFTHRRNQPYRCLWEAQTLDLPKLEELALSAEVEGWEIALFNILDSRRSGNSPNPTPVSELRALSLSRADNDGSLQDFLGTNQRRLQNLDSLAFVGCEGCGDKDVERLVTIWPKLRFLNLAGSAVTGVAVKKAAKLEHLETLVLNDCRSLGPDAVQWARDRGLRVEYKMKKEAVGAKKIRY